MPSSRELATLTSCILALLAFLQNERRKIKSHSLLRSVSSYQLYVCSKAYQIHVYLFIFSSIYICFSIRQNDKFLFSFCLSSIEDSRIQEVNIPLLVIKERVSILRSHNFLKFNQRKSYKTISLFSQTFLLLSMKSLEGRRKFWYNWNVLWLR